MTHLERVGVGGAAADQLDGRRFQLDGLNTKRTWWGGLVWKGEG